MKKPVFYRILFYVIGLLVLALGLTLNTKTGLGVSTEHKDRLRRLTDHIGGLQHLRDF